MTYVFEHMNELNIKMQGISENILTCSDKLHGLPQKLQLWQKEFRLGSLEMFPQSCKNQENAEKGFVLTLPLPRSSIDDLCFQCLKLVY